MATLLKNHLIFISIIRSFPNSFKLELSGKIMTYNLLRKSNILKRVKILLRRLEMGNEFQLSLSTSRLFDRSVSNFALYTF